MELQEVLILALQTLLLLVAPVVVIVSLAGTLMAAIQAENIGLGVHFRALHLHPYYRDVMGLRRGLCPVAEAASDRLFSIPLYPGLTEADIRDVVAALTKVLSVARTHRFPVRDPEPFRPAAP